VRLETSCDALKALYRFSTTDFAMRCWPDHQNSPRLDVTPSDRITDVRVLGWVEQIGEGLPKHWVKSKSRRLSLSQVGERPERCETVVK
jgi:hypothetical protein